MYRFHLISALSERAGLFLDIPVSKSPQLARWDIIILGFSNQRIIPIIT